MNLRQARFDDHWRHVFRRVFSTKFTAIDWHALPCLKDAHLFFFGGISVIVGSNGVGKSTLIAAISELLSRDSALVDTNYLPRLSGSTLEGVVTVKGVERKLRMGADADGVRTAQGDG